MSTETPAWSRAPCGLLSFDADGRILEAGGSLPEWVGCDAADLRGRPVDRLWSAAGRVFHSTHFIPLLKLHGRVDEVQLSLRTSSGEDVPVLASAVRAEGADGRIRYDCALMTVRRRQEFESALIAAREQAQAAATARDQFLALVSHELRTPLGAILGWVKLAQSGKLDTVMTARALSTIERNARMQSQLIEDLLDVSRITSGKLRLSPRPVELTGVVEAAMDTARPSAQAKDIELLCALDRSAGVVYADPDRMQQVVWNLLSNAVKFTPRGGRVQVVLSRAESRVRIEVADTGQGLSPAQLPYVFERFWQHDPTARREQAGLGLGLSICKSLIELHGGTIRADSDGPGRGARFTVELPLAVAASAPAGAATLATDPAPAATLQDVRVLVVDDDADARSLMRMLLETAGASVQLAASCDEALTALQTHVPDVLISDIGMPGPDGYELIRRIRAGLVPAAQGVRAIAVTGLARPQDRVSLLRAGFQAHLCKPVEPAEVVALTAALTPARRTDPAAALSL